MYQIWPFHWVVEVTCFTIQITVKEIFYHGHVPLIFVTGNNSSCFTTIPCQKRKFNGSKNCIYWTMNLEGFDNCTIYNFTLTINILFTFVRANGKRHIFELLRIGHLITLKRSLLVAFLCTDHVYHYISYCPHDTELWVS